MDTADSPEVHHLKRDSKSEVELVRHPSRINLMFQPKRLLHTIGWQTALNRSHGRGCVGAGRHLNPCLAPIEFGVS